MGNNCCVRDKGPIDTQNTSSINQQQSRHRYSLQQFQILEKLSHFNPKKNALPVALTHFLQDGCQGLMRSLPRLIEISEIYAPKGDQSHYFDPMHMQSQYGLTECVSPGKQFYLDELSDAFQQELKYFYSNSIIKESSASWGVILIMKIGKKTHSFSIKKRNGWEYVIHTLYEVTEEEIKEEQEELRKQQELQQERQKNRLNKLQDQKFNKETQQNIDKLNQLLFSEESTLQDEIIPLEDLNRSDSGNQGQSPDESASTANNSQKESQKNVTFKEKQEPKSQRQSFINPVKRCSELPRQSTRNTYRQIKQLRLRDMVFKGYNCGEICFSPFEIFLEYLNSIPEDYQQQIPNLDNPEAKQEKLQGFMQLVTFKKEFNLDLSCRQSQDNDYTNILSPEKPQKSSN
ncbi:hypothetical protein ABPG74_015875 [Tetrahymena malaccensis]